MNLQSYFATADLASLEEGELAGLVPYLTGRQLNDEVAVIATSAGRPYMLRTFALDRLGDEIACGIAAAYWARTSVDQVWLIGHGTQVDEAATAISGLAAALEHGGLTDKHRLIHLDPTRRNWRYVHEHDVLDWGPVRCTDPLTGRLAALAFHAACVATREAEAFAPRRSRFPGHELSEYQGGIEMLRSYTPDSPERDEADRELLERVLDAEDAETGSAVDLVCLGLALESRPRLTQAALAHIWSAPTEVDSGITVWSEIARLTHGSVRATACALAALAAWRHEDPLATIVAREAIAADSNCSFAQAVSAIVVSGALASNFVGDDDLAFLTEAVHEADGTTSGAEGGVV